jgi:hypothetical protein
MTQTQSTDLESLIEQARRKRVVYYNNVNGETITLQIGRVVYAMKRDRAAGFLRDALAQANAASSDFKLTGSE